MLGGRCAGLLVPLLASLVSLALVSGCKTQPPSVAPGESLSEQGPADSVAAWDVYESLEAEIAGEGASESARKLALERARSAPDDGSAAHAYARAAVAGRLAETRGLKALKLLDEVQEWALESIARDPVFEGMAATRMLGTLYVLGGQHMKDADSEEGLELLESVVDALPDDPSNHLRVAEGYIALGDPEPVFENLCRALTGRAQLREEEQGLLDRLLGDIGGADLLTCEGSGDAP